MADQSFSYDPDGIAANSDVASKASDLAAAASDLASQAMAKAAAGSQAAASASSVASDAYSYAAVAMSKASDASSAAAAKLADVVDDTTPQLGGDLDMNDKSINWKGTLASDHSWEGEVSSAVIGAAVAFGNLLYFNLSASRWRKADADSEDSMPARAVALSSAGDGSTALVLKKGKIRDDTWNFGVGSKGKIWAGTTAGSATTATPSGSGDIVQVVGYRVTADIMFFDPDNEYLELE